MCREDGSLSRSVDDHIRSQETIGWRERVEEHKEISRPKLLQVLVTMSMGLDFVLRIQ